MKCTNCRECVPEIPPAQVLVLGEPFVSLHPPLGRVGHRTRHRLYPPKVERCMNGVVQVAPYVASEGTDQRMSARSFTLLFGCFRGSVYA